MRAHISITQPIVSFKAKRTRLDISAKIPYTFIGFQKTNQQSGCVFMEKSYFSPNDFKDASDSRKIQAAINAARDSGLN